MSAAVWQSDSTLGHKDAPSLHHTNDNLFTNIVHVLDDATIKNTEIMIITALVVG